MDEKVLRALRAQAWERAKGELNAMLHTYYSAFDGEDKFVRVKSTIDCFVDAIEKNGLHE